MLHKEIPFLRIGLPFWAGIVYGSYTDPPYMFFIAAGSAALCILALSAIFKTRGNNHFFGASLTFCLFIAGSYFYSNEKLRISTLEESESVFAGYIDDYPQEKANSRSMILRIEKMSKDTGEMKVNGGILIYLRKGSAEDDFRPGDNLKLKCTPLSITNRGNPYEFNYTLYMMNQGVKYYAFADSSDIIGHSRPERQKIRHLALITREKIIEMFRARGITGDQLALVSAMTLGSKDMLDVEQKEAFIRAGVMHIMAVSGLHAVILSLFVFRVLFFLRGRFSIIRVAIALLLLWVFTFITGLTPSVLRATIMFTFLQAGKSMDRPVNGINSVLASAFVLSVMKPSVIFEAGFLLSYSAVIYIVGFYRDLYLLWSPKRRIPDLIWQSVAVTTVAQAGTLPLTIMMFNRFPVLFLLTNLVIVPLSSLVIILGFIVVLTYPVPFLSGITASVLSKLTWLTGYLTEKAASVPFSTIENIGMTPLSCLLLTLVIFFFCLAVFRKRKVSVLVPLSFLLLFILSGTITEMRTRRSNELTVYNSPQKLSVGIRKGKNLYLISDSAGVGKEAIRHSSLLDLDIENIPYPGRPLDISAGGKRIRICNSLHEALAGKLHPDIVYVLSATGASNRFRAQPAVPPLIIFGSTVRVDRRLESSLKALNADSVHFIRRNGAFSTSL